MILTLSAVIVKVIGLIYKIPMLGLLGSEGMGYFNCAYEIYALLCVISTSGLPVAMSVLISSSRDQGEDMIQRIFKRAMRLFLILGMVGTLVMLCFSYPFAKFLKSDRSFYSILAIAPTLIFVCIASAYRGYFQGLGKMLPTAVSQVIEAAGKLIIGLVAAWAALEAGCGSEMVAAFAVIGLVAGSGISAFYLFISKKIGSATMPDVHMCKADGITSRLLKTAVPITLSSAVISLTKLIDMTMILRRLQSIGFSSEDAFAAYGNYTTLALPLFALAPALIGSISLPLVPRLSRALAERDADAQMSAVNDALRLTMIVSMPISIGLSLYSYQILSVIFPNESGAVESTAPLLTMLALSVVLSCTVTVGNAILQAYGRPGVPMISMATGAAVKIVLAYLLIGNESINIAGAPISTFFCDLTINAVNFYYISRCLPRDIGIKKIMIAPFCASATAVVLSRVVYGYAQTSFGDSTVLTLLSIALAGMIYIPLCLIFKAVGKDDLEKIPILNKFTLGDKKYGNDDKRRKTGEDRLSSRM